MSGGIPGVGTRMGVRSVSGGRQSDFRRGGCRGGVPDSPQVKMKIDIVPRENKFLTHDLNEKNPTIM